MKSRKALLLGSYGQSNLGDDLLMLNYLEYLTAAGFKGIYVNASTIKNVPKPVNDNFPNLKVIETYGTSFIGWVKILKKMDVIVYGGGTIYKELYSSTGRSRYSVISRILFFNVTAFMLRKQIINLHIGLGSIKTWSGRTITKLSLRSCYFTIFRDRQSYEYTLNTLKLPPKKFCYSTDGLFLNKRWSKVWRDATLDIPKGRYKKIIGINVLSDIPDWIDREAYIKTLITSVTQLLEDGNFVIFMPFQHNFSPSNDFIFMKENIIPALSKYDNYELVESIPIDEVNSYYRKLDVFIGMRFHSLLLAAVNNTPFLAIAYDTKCWRFIEDTGYDYAIKLEDLSLERLSSSYDNLIHNLEEVSRILQKISKNNFNEAHKCLDKIF